MNAAPQVEYITNNEYDTVPRLRALIAEETEGQFVEPQEVPLTAMTDVELVAVIINDPDTATRRKALHVMRMREFSAGISAGTKIVMEAL